MSPNLYLITKPKNSTIKVYIYNTVIQEYQYLERFMTLPTFSQAFEKFLEENYLDILMNDYKCKIKYKDATPFTIPVNCETKRKWDNLPKAKKEAGMWWFNHELWWEINIFDELLLASARQSFYGGKDR